MLLYGLPHSAYSAKVRIALRLKGLDFEEVPPPDGYRSAAYRAIVPTGTVPALDIGGRVLFESDAIVEYLDEIVPEPPLLPSDPQMRAVARAAARHHDGRIEPVIRGLFPLIGAEPLDRAAFQATGALLEDRLSRMGEAFDPDPFIAGAGLSLSDLAYPGTLAMGKRLLGEGGVVIERPTSIDAWVGALMDEPVVNTAVDEMLAALENWIASKKDTSA